KGFRSDALAALSDHGWPGNVCELENGMKRAVIMAEGTRIQAADLDLEASEYDGRVLSLKEAREAAERREIPRALSQSDGNVSKAAKLLGVSRPTLYDLMRHHSIKMP
ncbi:MAG: helix-turn-helix domain-containing protein, partial [Alphaproteobacteria bacterium]